MVNETSNDKLPSTLLEAAVERTHLSWSQLAAVVGFVQLALLAGIAYTTGKLLGPYDPAFWSAGLMPPIIIVFLLLRQSKSQLLRNEAIRAVRPLVQLDDNRFRQVVHHASFFNRRREWTALGLGVLAGSLFRVTWGFITFWLDLYLILFGGLMFGIMAWFIYSALSGTRLFDELNRHIQLNIFNVDPLVPIARWSLNIALTLISGTTLSVLVTVPDFSITLFTNPAGAILYGSLITATIFVFFLTNYSTHRSLLDAKNQELEHVKGKLAEMSDALKGHSGQNPTPLEESLNTITCWVTYEQRIKEVSEWPYTSQIKGNLAVSVFISIAAFLLPWMLRGVMFQFLLELLPIN